MIEVPNMEVFIVTRSQFMIFIQASANALQAINQLLRLPTSTDKSRAKDDLFVYGGATGYVNNGMEDFWRRS